MLTEVKEWVRERMAGKPDKTLDEPTAALRKERSIEVHRSSVGRPLHGLGPSHRKKTTGQASGSVMTWPGSARSG